MSLGKIDHSRRLDKVYLEDLSFSCRGELWLSLGNLGFTLIEYAFLVILVIEFG